MIHNISDLDPLPLPAESSSFSDSTCMCLHNNSALSICNACPSCNEPSGGCTPLSPNSSKRKRFSSDIPANDMTPDNSQASSMLLDNIEAQIEFVEKAFDHHNGLDTYQEVQTLLCMLNVTSSGNRSTMRNMIQDLYVAADIKYFSIDKEISTNKEKIIHALKALNDRNCLLQASTSESSIPSLNVEQIEMDQRPERDTGAQGDTFEAISSTTAFETNNFNIRSLNSPDKIKLIVKSLSCLLDAMFLGQDLMSTSSSVKYNHILDILQYYATKYQMSREKIKSEVEIKLSPNTKKLYDFLWQQTIMDVSRNATYPTTIKAFRSYNYRINPLAPINHLFKEIHYSGLCRNDTLFHENNKISYSICNSDPFINTSGILDFEIQIICRSELLSDINNQVSRPTELDNILFFGPGKDHSMISQPLHVSSHDKFLYFGFNFSNNTETIVISIKDLKSILIPIASDLKNSNFKPLNIHNEPINHNEQIQIPISNPEDIIPFYQRMNAFRPSITKHLPKAAKFVYSKELCRLSNTLSDAIDKYRINDAKSKIVLDIALTQWLVMPTFFLLFPSSKSNRIWSKMESLIAERSSAVFERAIEGHSHLIVDIKHLFNKIGRTDRVSGKIKTAEKKIFDRKFSLASDILKSLNTPYTAPTNSNDILNSLAKLTPNETTINGNKILGKNDLEDFASKLADNNFNSDNEVIQDVFNRTNIRKVLLDNSRRNTSAGIDRLSAEFLYSLIRDTECCISNELLDCLVRLYNRLLRAPSHVWRYINIASLHGIPKSDDSYRPIANGTQWRKIFGTIILQHFHKDILECYGDSQFASKKLATEKVSSIARHWFNNQEESYIIKFDIRNAFNSFLRSVALHEIIKKIPTFGHILSKMFCMPLPLIFQESACINAVLGSQQGCIFGAVLFNFAFQKIIESLKEKFHMAHTISYMDDNITLIKGSAVDVLEYVNSFKQECHFIGLEINFKKSSILIPKDSMDVDLPTSLIDIGFDQANIIDRSFESSKPTGLVILGCPIGNDIFIMDYLTDYFDDYSNVIHASKRLSSLHCRWSLARNSLYCKLVYIMRMVPPEYTKKFFLSIEDLDWSIIESIMKLDDLDHINANDIDNLKKCSKLKISQGGFGLRDYELLAKSAFLGSQLAIFEELYAFFEKKNFQLSECGWFNEIKSRISNLCAEVPLFTHLMQDNSMHPDDSYFIKEFISKCVSHANKDTSPNNIHKLQALFYKKNFDTKFSNLIPKNDSTAHNWLLVDPATLSEPISNATYRRMFRADKNINFVNPNVKRTCICNKEIDPKEKHFSGCQFFGIKQRHNNVARILGNFFKAIDAKPYVGEIEIKSLESYFDNTMYSAINNIRTKSIHDNLNSINSTENINPSSSSYSVLSEAINKCTQASTKGNLSNSADSSENINSVCPPHTTQSNGPNNNAFFSPTSLNSKISTKDNRVDIITNASWLQVMMDVTIVNNVLKTEKEYLEKFSNAEKHKISIHLNKVKQTGYSYFVPIFSTDGSPSKNTKNVLQSYYNMFLKRLYNDSSRSIESLGNLTDHYLNQICFQINRDNAEHANLHNFKIFQKSNSSSGINPLPLSDHDHNENLKARYILKKSNRF